MNKIETHNELCRDCQACLLVCSLVHEGACSPDLARLTVTKDMERYKFVLSICQHCDDPACLDACPSGALRRDDRGVVILHEDDCSHCGLCAEACPYQAIYYSAARDKYLKCDLCAGRTEGALCVVVCPVGALTMSGG